MEGLGLESIPVFASLSPRDRARVASVARLLHWDTGHVALREGEFAFDLYVIKLGAAELQQRGQRLAALGAGDCFGELGVSQPDSGRWSRRRTASVVVTAPSDVIAIDGVAIRRLSDELPELRDALRGLAATRSRGETPYGGSHPRRARTWDGRQVELLLQVLGVRKQGPVIRLPGGDKGEVRSERGRAAAAYSG